jgi:uncharacterized protein (DUF488 family)
MKKPTYKRQKALLALLDIFGGELSKLELQKYMFLYVHEFSSDEHYGFVPYHYGSFSYELYKDLNTMQRNLVLNSDEKSIYLLSQGFIKDVSTDEQNTLKKFFTKYKNLKGNELISYIYKKYPYFAINSKISKRFLSASELEKYKPHSTDTALFTVGYEGKKFETYLNQLIKSDIKILVDVRKNAHSMKYGFSKSTLKNAVEKLGIRYIHIPTLGIESENRQELNTKEDYLALFAKYQKTLTQKSDELNHLNDLVKSKKRVAITCFEKDVEYCHRGVIAKEINKQYGTDIKHL